MRPSADSHRHPLAWPLKSYVMGLVFLATLITFGAIAAVAIGTQLPNIQKEAQSSVSASAQREVRKQEAVLQSAEEQLQLLAIALGNAGEKDAGKLFTRVLRDHRLFSHLYLLGADGRALAASTLPANPQGARDQLGADPVSAFFPLAARARIQQGAVWDAHIITRDGGRTIALAIPLEKGRVVLGEIQLAALLHGLSTVHEVSNTLPALTVLGRDGHVYVDTAWAPEAGLKGWGALGRSVWEKRPNTPLTMDLDYQGKSYVVSMDANQRLDWVVIARRPGGLDNPRTMALTRLLAGGCLGALLISMLLSRWWLVKPESIIQRLVQQANHMSEEGAQTSWPWGPVEEFNQLSVNLSSMVTDLKAQRMQFQAIFDISPVPLIVYDYERDQVSDLNKAACTQFGLERAEWIQKSGRDLPIWPPGTDLARVDPRLLDEKTLEAKLGHADGHDIICLISVRVLERNTDRWQVWALQDVTQSRKDERALRELNEALERRVAERTEELQRANDEASQAIDRMHETRDYLVRSEKMAALGGLVAGVAHELNTPLGNSLMALTTLSEETLKFKTALAQSLRKATLDAWVACVDQATSISTRNLTRAADLVSSFKQVAVDQSSAQRRTFTLDELVGEITLTLRPSYARLPIEFDINIQRGITVDSYPGHLGQVLTNLISNAIVHGFEDGRAGTIQIVGSAVGADRVQLKVTDNGKGIPADLLGRVFDPFVTTRMGQGGTGLGLNIAFNAATHVLGGEIWVESEVGRGTTFTVEIPRVVPKRVEVSDEDVQTWL